MTEYWVMRVVSDVPRDQAAMVALLEGRYQLVNGDVVEPIECFEDADGERAQRRAQERAIAEHARTGCVHKVVLNAELTDLVGSQAQP